MEKLKNEVLLVYNILRLIFGIVPIVAGADKFLNILTQWDIYLNPSFLMGLDANLFMMGVGVVEILAGILVLINTRMGTLVVSTWLLLIAISLILSGSHFDVAVRDIVLSIVAFLLARLSIIKSVLKK